MLQYTPCVHSLADIIQTAIDKLPEQKEKSLMSGETLRRLQRLAKIDDKDDDYDREIALRNLYSRGAHNLKAYESAITMKPYEGDYGVFYPVIKPIYGSFGAQESTAFLISFTDPDTQVSRGLFLRFNSAIDGYFVYAVYAMEIIKDPGDKDSLRINMWKNDLPRILRTLKQYDPSFDKDGEDYVETELDTEIFEQDLTPENDDSDTDSEEQTQEWVDELNEDESNEPSKEFVKPPLDEYKKQS